MGKTGGGGGALKVSQGWRWGGVGNSGVAFGEETWGERMRQLSRPSCREWVIQLGVIAPEACLGAISPDTTCQGSLPRVLLCCTPLAVYLT